MHRSDLLALWSLCGSQLRTFILCWMFYCLYALLSLYVPWEGDELMSLNLIVKAPAHRLAMKHCAPRPDRVVVMARPSPVPPPVIRATLLLKLPGSNMAPSQGGKLPPSFWLRARLQGCNNIRETMVNRRLSVQSNALDCPFTQRCELTPDTFQL